MLDELALQKSIRDDKFVSNKIQSGSVEAVWALANACSNEELPRLSSPGILIGNSAVEQLDGRVTLDNTTLGTVRATVIDDASRGIECVHIQTLQGLGGGACSDEALDVAQLRIWFCETSELADIEGAVPQSQECRSAIPATNGTPPPAMVIVGAADESELSVELADGRVIRENTHVVQGTEKRFFAIPIAGSQEARVISVLGVTETEASDNLKEEGTKMAPRSGIRE